MKLTFTPQELDYVVQVLAQRPWAEVHLLIENIQQQVKEQQGPTPKQE